MEDQVDEGKNRKEEVGGVNKGGSNPKWMLISNSTRNSVLSSPHVGFQCYFA